MLRRTDLKVIELGTGCGIVGIYIASAIPDCSCLLTDLPEAMDLLRRNSVSSSEAVRDRLSCEELDWMSPLPAVVTTDSWDLVVVSDCTYNPDTVPMLVETMLGLAVQSPQALFLIAMKKRHDSEAIFFDLVNSKGFSVVQHKAIISRKETEVP